MVDNVQITPGTGNTIAADEVADVALGTVKVQYVKLMDGTADGTAKAAVGSNGLKVDPSAVTSPVSIAGTVNTAVTSSALPSGASTSAFQNTGNASLSSIDTKTPALGQALSAASVPVVLPATQLSTLTPPTTVTVTQGTGTNLHTTVDNFPATQPISGTVTANAGSGTFGVSGAVTANAGTNLNTSLLALDSTVSKDSTLGTINSSINTLLKPASTLAAVTAITNTVTIKADTAINQTNALKVDGSATTQPVSGTITANIGTSGSLALDTSVNSLLKPASTLAAITSITNPVAATQSGSWTTTVTQATGTNLHAVIDSGTTTVTQGTGTNLHTVVDSGSITATISGTPTVNQGTSPWLIRASPKQTYMASTSAPIVAVAGTGPFFAIYGSASKTVTLQRILISGANTTAVGYVVYSAVKYSTAPTGGTAAALTQVPLDSNFNAATLSLCSTYSVAPTAGNAVGTIASLRTVAQASTPAAAGLTDEVDFDFRTISDASGVVLRGATQGVGLVFPVAPATAATLSLYVVWTEE